MVLLITESTKNAFLKLYRENNCSSTFVSLKKVNDDLDDIFIDNFYK